jgi:predicted TIM-barrel fold metal-dependent hydrolase
MNTAVSKTFVDSHFHVFKAAVAQPGARYVPHYDAPMQAWQAQAQTLGVQRGVLVQPSFLGTDNSHLLRELIQNPQTLRGVVVLRPDTPIVELERLNALGVRGIRLNLAGVSHQMESWQQASTFWDALLALGWHLELHTDIGALPGVLAQLPSMLPLVLDHMGKPDALCLSDPSIKAVLERAAHCTVYIKLSGPYRLGGRDACALARLWQSELGDHRLLWGSDWPFTNHEHEAHYPTLFPALRAWVGEEALQAVLVGNPNAVYWGCPSVYPQSSGSVALDPGSGPG